MGLLASGQYDAEGAVSGNSGGISISSGVALTSLHEKKKSWVGDKEGGD